MILVWFPWWLSGKEPASIAGDAGGVDLFPGLGRSLEEEMTISGGKMAILVGGNGNPLQCSCLENPIESQRAGHNWACKFQENLLAPISFLGNGKWILCDKNYKCPSYCFEPPSSFMSIIVIEQLKKISFCRSYFCYTICFVPLIMADIRFKEGHVFCTEIRFNEGWMLSVYRDLERYQKIPNRRS